MLEGVPRRRGGGGGGRSPELERAGILKPPLLLPELCCEEL